MVRPKHMDRQGRRMGLIPGQEPRLNLCFQQILGYSQLHYILILDLASSTCYRLCDLGPCFPWHRLLSLPKCPSVHLHWAMQDEPVLEALASVPAAEKFNCQFPDLGLHHLCFSKMCPRLRPASSTIPFGEGKFFRHLPNASESHFIVRRLDSERLPPKDQRERERADRENKPETCGLQSGSL